MALSIVPTSSSSRIAPVDASNTWVSVIAKEISRSVNTIDSSYAHPICVTKNLIGRPHTDLDARNLAALLYTNPSASKQASLASLKILSLDLTNVKQVFDSSVALCDELSDLVNIAWRERFDVCASIRTTHCLHALLTNVQTAIVLSTNSDSNIATGAVSSPQILGALKRVPSEHVDVAPQISVGVHDTDYFKELAPSNLLQLAASKKAQFSTSHK